MASIVFALVLLALPTAAQQKEFEIATNGETDVKVNLAKKPIEVNFSIAKVKKNDPGFTLALDYYDEVSVVRKLTISVSGEMIWVPRSVYSDLFNVRNASIRTEKESYVLVIGGADASDLYSVRVVFTSNRVISRTVYGHSVSPPRVTEITQFSKPQVVN